MAKKGIEESLKLLSMAKQITVTKASDKLYEVEFYSNKTDYPVSASIEILNHGEVKTSYFIEFAGDCGTKKFPIDFQSLKELRGIVGLLLSEKSDE